MNYFPLLILTMLTFLFEKSEEVKVSEAVMLSARQPAGGAYFTTDEKKQVVLCWTEGEKDAALLHFAYYNNQQAKFSKAITVPFSKGTVIGSESMNKLAFKKDGTIVAVYERKHPSSKNRFAGSIYYTQSFDKGKTWTTEKTLHSDTVRDVGRSFFDMATLPDGEVGIVWLDGRYKSGKDGSALFFTKTEGKKGFRTEAAIAETVCQCCRTELFADQKGLVHILFRDIENSLKGQIRDFVHLQSVDNGKTFTRTTKVSNDNWAIEGCPHTGASMTYNNAGLQVVWFTAGGVPGLYYTSSNNQGKSFDERQLISENARHAQIASNESNSLIIFESSSAKHANEHASHGGTHSMAKQTENSLITVSIVDSNGSIKYTIDVNEDGGEFPVICSIGNSKFLTAYSYKNQVMVREIKLEK